MIASHYNSRHIYEANACLSAGYWSATVDNPFFNPTYGVSITEKNADTFPATSGISIVLNGNRFAHFRTLERPVRPTLLGRRLSMKKIIPAWSYRALAPARVSDASDVFSARSIPVFHRTCWFDTGPIREVLAPSVRNTGGQTRRNRNELLQDLYGPVRLTPLTEIRTRRVFENPKLVAANREHSNSDA